MVKQSFIRRLLGYCELSLGKIDAAAENSDDQQKGLSQQGLVIHPFVKMSRVPEILAGIVPEFADVPTENIPHPPMHHPGDGLLVGRPRGGRADRGEPPGGSCRA